MTFINNLFLNCFSIILLLILFFYSKRYSNTELKHNRVFLWLVASAMLMLIFDSVGRLDGRTETILSALNRAGIFLLYIFSPAASAFWLLFVFHYKKHNEKLFTAIAAVISAITAANFIIVVLSLKNRWIYYLDEQNVYHRGPHYPIPFVFSFILLALASLVVYKKRKRIQRRHLYALLLFPIPPVLCAVLQLMIYGYSFIFNGVALTILVVFLYVQNQDVFTDYLTGVANRKKLEFHLSKMIRGSSPGRTFSAILLDLDNFKNINDTFGHKAGDEALKKAAELLQACVDKNDLIARYGGDEFFVVLDTSDADALNKTVEKIKTEFRAFNAKNLLPYKLELSMGYAIYTCGMDADIFINILDKYMYKHKNRVSL